MTVILSKLTSKAQTVIPREIRARLDLKPGEKRDIPLKFSIEHPADLPVTGVE